MSDRMTEAEIRALVGAFGARKATMPLEPEGFRSDDPRADFARRWNEAAARLLAERDEALALAWIYGAPVPQPSVLEGEWVVQSGMPGAMFAAPVGCLAKIVRSGSGWGTAGGWGPYPTLAALLSEHPEAGR